MTQRHDQRYDTSAAPDDYSEPAPRRAPGRTTVSARLPGRSPEASSPGARHVSVDPWKSPSGGAPTIQFKALQSALGTDFGKAADSATVGSAFSGPPRSLPDAGRIERSLGTDLSNVEMYSGPGATAACEAMNARAFTVGNRIAFANDNPDLHLQAHEAAHTIQQATAPQRVQRKGDVGALEAEADRAADAVVSGASFRVSSGSASTARPQRKAMNNTTLRTQIGDVKHVLYVGKDARARFHNTDRPLSLEGGKSGRLLLVYPVTVTHAGKVVCKWHMRTNLQISADDKGELTYTQHTTQKQVAVAGGTNGNMNVIAQVKLNKPPTLYVHAVGDTHGSSKSSQHTVSGEGGVSFIAEGKAGYSYSRGSGSQSQSQANRAADAWVPLGIRGVPKPAPTGSVELDPSKVLVWGGHVVTYERNKQTKMSSAQYGQLVAWWKQLPEQIRKDVRTGRRKLTVVGHASPPGPARELNRKLSKQRRTDVLKFFEGRVEGSANISGLWKGEHDAKTRSVHISISHTTSKPAAGQ